MKETEKLEQNDVRRRLPRFQEENLKQNIRLVQRLEEIGRSKGCSAPQLALAWLLAKADEIVPIPARNAVVIWKKMSERWRSR